MPVERSPTKSTNSDDVAESNSFVPGDRVATLTNLKITCIWSDEPELWFLHLEAIFRARRITSDQTKYDLAVGAIEDVNIVRQVSDLIRTPPRSDKYDTFKRQLIARLTDSKDRQFDRLLHDLNLGNKKPSHLLREMRNLVPATMDDTVLRPTWMSRMPSNVRCVLSASVDVPLADLVDIADRIMENSPQTYVMATSSFKTDKPQQHSITADTEDRLSLIEHSLTEFTAAVKSLSTSVNKIARDTRSRSKSRTSSHYTTGTCFYHQTFGSDAKKCTQPCTYKTPSTKEN